MDLVGKDKPIISDADEKIWKSVYDQKLSIDEEIFWLKDKYPKDWKRLSEQIWRRIHYYPVIDQIEWFKKYSNVQSIYGDKLIVQKFCIALWILYPFGNKIEKGLDYPFSANTKIILCHFFFFCFFIVFFQS